MFLIVGASFLRRVNHIWILLYPCSSSILPSRLWIFEMIYIDTTLRSNVFRLRFIAKQHGFKRTIQRQYPVHSWPTTPNLLRLIPPRLALPLPHIQATPPPLAPAPSLIRKPAERQLDKDLPKSSASLRYSSPRFALQNLNLGISITIEIDRSSYISSAGFLGVDPLASPQPCGHTCSSFQSTLTPLLVLLY